MPFRLIIDDNAVHITRRDGSTVTVDLGAAPTDTRPLGEIYPGDAGIAADPAVIMTSDFESEDWQSRDLGLESYAYRDRGQRIVDPSLAYSGTTCLQHFNQRGTHYTQWHRPYFPERGADQLYLRWYHKFEDGYDLSMGGVKSNGLYASEDGVIKSGRPNGHDKFSLRINISKHWQPKLYFYHPDQHYSTGEARPMNLDPDFTIEPGRWYCIEIMLKANDAGVRNGEIKAWFDGQLKAHHTGFRFRDTNDLKINMLYLGAYFGGDWTSPKDQYCWDDNLVIATKYVGPMT